MTASITGGAAKGHVLAFVCVLLWGMTFVASKILLSDGFDAFNMLVLRFVTAYLVLLVIRPRMIHTSSIREELPYALCGLFGVTLYFLAENTALMYTYASNVGIIVGFAPILTALLMFIFYRSKPSKYYVLGFIVAIVGVALVGLNGGELKLSLLGDGITLLAALTWAFYNVNIRKIVTTANGSDTILATRRIFFWGLVTMVPLYFFYGWNWNIQAYAKPSTWLCLIFLALIASALCYIIWNRAISLIGETKTTAYLYLQPVVTVIFASIVLGEPISVSAVAGILLITMGLLLSEKRIGPKGDAAADAAADAAEDAAADATADAAEDAATDAAADAAAAGERCKIIGEREKGVGENR